MINGDSGAAAVQSDPVQTVYMYTHGQQRYKAVGMSLPTMAAGALDVCCEIISPFWGFGIATALKWLR